MIPPKDRSREESNSVFSILSGIMKRCVRKALVDFARLGFLRTKKSESADDGERGMEINRRSGAVTGERGQRTAGEEASCDRSKTCKTRTS